MKPQLAKHLYVEMGKKKPSCIGKNYIVSEKLDGWYGYADITPAGNFGIHSRAGRVVPSLSKYAFTLSNRAGYKTISGRLIFEITISTIKDFHTLNGVLNRSKGACHAPDVVLKVHDFIPTHQPNMLAMQRYDLAKQVVLDLDLSWIQFHDALDICETRKAKSWAEHVWGHGGEGVILKQVDAPYMEGKRNSTLLKIKEDCTAELLVVDKQEGKGKYEGTLGALICKDAAGNHHTISGMTDEERYQWWTNFGAIKGKVIEIKAMQRLKDGSFREPRYKAVRFDKTPSQID